MAEFVEVETGKGSDALDRRPQLSAAQKMAQKQGTDYCRQARPAVPRRSFHLRAHDAQNTVYRGGAGC